MEYEEAEELAEILLKRALSGNKSEFRFLRQLGELGAAIAQRRATSKVAKNFDRAAKRLLRKHIKDLKDRKERCETLMMCRQMRICADFYFAEADTLKDMIAEYRCYLRYGHFMQALVFDSIRPEEDCVDWRTVPFGW